MASHSTKFRIAGIALLPVGSLIVALLFLSVVFGGLFSTTGQNAALPGETRFAVCLKVCDRPEQAQREAVLIKNRNGAGFVWQEKGYRVLAAVYQTRAEQQSVLAKLTASGESATAFDITLPSVKVSTDLSPDLFQSAVDLFLRQADSVSALALEVDRGLNEDTARAELAKLLEQELPPLGSDTLSIRLRAEYKTLQFNLNLTASKTPFSSSLKHLSIQILWDLRNFLMDIGE